MRLTYEYSGDAQSIREGQFATALRKICKERKPMRVLESGTCKGTGTTKILLESIPSNADFRTIEINPIYVKQAIENIAVIHHSLKGSCPKTRIYNKLSIPKSLVPNGQLLHDRLFTDLGPEVWVDYHEHERERIYTSEVGFNVKDDAIGEILQDWNGQCDFALLDSAGFMGLEEFLYLVDNLESDCIIALDDVNHIKHFQTLQLIKRVHNCRIIAQGEEKFGWAIIERKAGIE